MKSGGTSLFGEQVSTNDNVNHPAHYNTGKYESIDVMVETQGAAAVKISVSAMHLNISIVIDLKMVSKI